MRRHAKSDVVTKFRDVARGEIISAAQEFRDRRRVVHGTFRSRHINQCVHIVRQNQLVSHATLLMAGFNAS